MNKNVFPPSFWLGFTSTGIMALPRTPSPTLVAQSDHVFFVAAVDARRRAIPLVWLVTVHACMFISHDLHLCNKPQLLVRSARRRTPGLSYALTAVLNPARCTQGVLRRLPRQARRGPGGRGGGLGDVAVPLLRRDPACFSSGAYILPCQVLCVLLFIAHSWLTGSKYGLQVRQLAGMKRGLVRTIGIFFVQGRRR